MRKKKNTTQTSYMVIMKSLSILTLSVKTIIHITERADNAPNIQLTETSCPLKS